VVLYSYRILTGLGALFVVTNSLLAVVVAHYLVNALELTIHEGLGIDRLGA